MVGISKLSYVFFFFSSRRRHTRYWREWSSDVCSSDLGAVRRGESVAVFGCGGVGDAAIAGARLAGATTIVAVDVEDRKLEWAREFGATHTVDSRATDPVEAVRALTGGFGVDVAIDAVGRPEVFQQAFYARDLAGRVVLVGVPTPDMQLTLPMIELFGRGGALKSSWFGEDRKSTRLNSSHAHISYAVFCLTK